MASFIEAILRAKVAQICSHIGYNSITADSTNILIDIYRRTIIHLARHCKEAANNNRRVEPTIVDLIQAYNFVGISIPELQDHIQNVRLPFDKEIPVEETKQPSNRIQRNALVDDLLELKKSNNLIDQDEDGENKLNIDEGAAEKEDQMSQVPLLRDVYVEIANQFPIPSQPVKPDKLRIKREEKPAIPRLKITPLDPAIAEPPSFLPLLDGPKEERTIPITIKAPQTTPPGDKKRGPKSKANIKVSSTKTKQKAKLKTKLKIKSKSKTKIKGKKSKSALVTDESLDNQPTIDTNLPSPTRSPIAPPSPQQIFKPPTPVVEPITKIRTPAPEEDPIRKSPTPPVHFSSSTKQASKGKKKKKKSNNQFAILTESVKASAETDDAEWLCPVCNGPDNGDLMLQCEGTCELWFHLKCTGLKKEPKEDENWECNTCVTSKIKQEPSSSKKSSKGSKKRDKSSHDINIKIETKTPTPQPSTSISPPPAPPLPPQPPVQEPLPPQQIVQAPIKQESYTETSQPNRQPVLGGSSEDLCPECQLPDDGTLMIQCDDPFCAKWFHGKCVNVLSAPEDNDSWFCKVCVDKQQSAFKRRRRVK